MIMFIICILLGLFLGTAGPIWAFLNSPRHCGYFRCQRSFSLMLEWFQLIMSSGRLPGVLLVKTLCSKSQPFTVIHQLLCFYPSHFMFLNTWWAEPGLPSLGFGPSVSGFLYQRSLENVSFYPLTILPTFVLKALDPVRIELRISLLINLYLDYLVMLPQAIC